MFKKDKAILFWRSDATGYTYNVKEAGLYPANAIPGHHPSDDDLVSCELVEQLAIHAVFDNMKLGMICLNTPKNRKLLGMSIGELLVGKGHDRVFSTPKEFVSEFKDVVTLVNEIRAKKLG